MRSDGDKARAGQGVTGERFAGDVLLRLAREGWLVVPPDQASRVIADLEWTLKVVRARVRRAELSRRLRDVVDCDVDPAVDRLVVDAAFAGQVASGTWEQALVELPKYIEAFRIAGGRR
ncbi:hypothetical protein [Saccharothrix australiensis]|uniref:Uncharacterized protein n=1 Tax=Saccharothrix australiensis TaxID=2072 RepID=A0A495W3U6_9PSEU|nr:hypothetical protein [Saccharothrix australiensis]RKT55343.1 hypothetical protein C8E97_4006 [Saccharothrix australiensis]